MPTLAELQKRSPFVRPSTPQGNQETLISDSRSRITAAEFVDQKLRIALDRSSSSHLRGSQGERRLVS